ncbi:hypothetical protein E1B28_007082 [Marasmius oreades]|uniref:Zn(2)-C6 fungal-type domain-containing protein n=1 Tax=Marasmius oreades TaxID=181124 RepID=A0A9P7S1M5_9AGAR|nr:uncharacterized protein E1B28_007082 [Marasmius oreades]KAG7093400.1 hypothetical protein E1B28_007082 [Marasmius oreades]
MSEESSSSSSPSGHPIGLPQKKSQATSCAECRRLKLKCDRVFPCSSCIRRGCANLCPTGTLEKGKRGFLKRLEQSLPSSGNRTVDPNSGEPTTEVAMFVARDAAMSKRIQELESALINAGVPVPGLPHAVAKRTTALSHKRTRSSPSMDDDSDKMSCSERSLSPINAADSADVTMGFGTLTIDPLNRAKYIGLSGASAYLSSDIWSCSLEKRTEAEETVPDYALNSEVQLALLGKLSVLPSYEEAIRLSKLYFLNDSYMYEIVSQEIFMKEHLTTAYERFTAQGGHVAPDTLALVTMVLAIGQYYDMTRSSEDLTQRVTELFDVAVYALNINNAVNGATCPRTIQGIQALHLMATYQLSVKAEVGAEAAWQILGIACRSLQTQGLHRDGSRWGLPLKELEERRRVFWETYTFDRLQSFMLGRPYSLIDAHHDCEMPTTSNIPLLSDVDNSNTFSHTRFHHHKFRWAILIGRIVDLAFSARQLTYDIIKQVDREINDYYFSLPTWIRCPVVTRPVEESVWKRVCSKAGSRPHGPHPDFASGLGKVEDQQRDAQIYTLATSIFVAILHLHRAPFCRALMMEPQELVRSPYESSVSRVTSAATTIINITRGLYVLHPGHTSRVWYWLYHVFTAAVCQAVFVCTAPFHPLAPQAFKSLQAALELLDRAEGPRAATARSRLKIISQKAAASMDRYLSSSFAKSRSRRETPNNSPPLDSTINLPFPPPGANKPPPPRFPESYLRGATGDFLGISTKLVRLGSPPHSGSGSTSAESASRSSCSSPMSVTSISPGEIPPPPSLHHRTSPNDNENLVRQSHNQQRPQERHCPLEPLDIFESATGNTFDPWFQTFMAIGPEKDVNATPIPPGPNLGWAPGGEQGTMNTQSNFQPPQFDPNSFNDLDFAVDPAGVRELQSLLEWRHTINVNLPPNAVNGPTGMNQNDAFGLFGASNVFDSSNFMQDGTHGQWLLDPYKAN